MIPWLPQFLCDSRVPFHKVFHYRSPIVLDCSQPLWYSASCNRLLQFVSASPGLRKCSLGCHCIVLLWSSTINESLLFQNSSHRNCPSVGRGWSMAPFLWLDWFYGSVSAQELPPRMLPKFLHASQIFDFRARWPLWDSTVHSRAGALRTLIKNSIFVRSCCCDTQLSTHKRTVHQPHKVLNIMLFIWGDHCRTCVSLDLICILALLTNKFKIRKLRAFNSKNAPALIMFKSKTIAL